MKTTTSIRKSLRAMVAVMALALGALGLSAQNSLPAPGSGGSFQPNPGPGMGMGMGPGPGFGNPGPPPPVNWGSPWYSGWNSPTIVINAPTTTTIPNSGVTKVVACGYDAMGVWRVLPLVVSYKYNGVQYDVDVLNAWNPWTDQWNKGIDQQAFNTTYWLKNVQYDYYVPLSFGTFYFNL